MSDEKETNKQLGEGLIEGVNDTITPTELSEEVLTILPSPEVFQDASNISKEGE